MRKTQVLYVEDDPALRTILTGLLSHQPRMEIVASVGNAQDAVEAARSSQCDVALIDLALGADSANGFELALQLRRLSNNIGIVIYSQHASAHLGSQIPPQEKIGWSIIQKKAPIDIAGLVKILKSTSLGSSFVQVDENFINSKSGSGGFLELSKRQHEIMSLLIEGFDVAYIAESLGVSQVTIRQDLSRIYKVLVPTPQPGTDLRTTAVLKYLRQSRSYAWNNAE